MTRAADWATINRKAARAFAWTAWKERARQLGWKAVRWAAAAALAVLAFYALIVVLYFLLIMAILLAAFGALRSLAI